MLKLKKIRIVMLLLCCTLFGLLPVILPAAGFGKDMGFGFQKPNPERDKFQHARADRWKFVGRTVFLEGNVFIPYGNLMISADSAMVDMESRDVEAKGNVVFVTARKQVQNVTLEELERLQELTTVYTEILGINTDALGQQKFRVSIFHRGGSIECERLSGNLISGLITFTDMRLRTSTYSCKAKRAIRQPGGELKLEDVQVSNCDYIFDDNSHISMGMTTANLYPHQTEGFGFQNMEKERNEYSLWGYNSTLRVYGVPIFWLPMIYTPKDESPGLFTTRIGYNGDWGFHVLMSKKFQLMDYPSVVTGLDLDFYSKRGIGFGERTKIVTENSFTEINAYGIHDLEPYESSGDKRTGRFEIPKNRFDFQLAHRTHLTPRLDFRAQLEWMSDPYMLDDFFSLRADNIDEPPSFAALEYQGDRYSAALYARFQVNDFYTTIQKLPEARLDLPRQEIIPEWGIYYQGSHSADYLRMNWALFDRPLKRPASRVKNYETGRFDSVNFLYYPIRTRFINIVPRAGLRMTGYTNTSRTRITQKDIFVMQTAMDEEHDFARTVKNYDDRGKAKFRMIAEFGVEANTKIYNSWQNVRSEFFGLDGLRHVIEPYVNYTFITDPTVNRDKLLFFDDIDRISELHFIRFGVRNRLQTRNGKFHNAKIRQWFEMENYWDFYIHSEDDFNSIGDFCTKMTFSPLPQLSFATFFSIDAGNNQTHDVQSYRGRRPAGRPHISGNFFNRLYFSVRYKPIEDVTLALSYHYKDACYGRAAYSMGSTLTELDSGTLFDQYYVPDRTQTITFSTVAPLTPDRRTYGSYRLTYDLEEGGFTKQTFMISRLFHCVRLGAIVEFERDRDGGEVEYDVNFGFQLTLANMEQPLDRVRRNAVAAFTGLN